MPSARSARVQAWPDQSAVEVASPKVKVPVARRKGPRRGAGRRGGGPAGATVPRELDLELAVGVRRASRPAVPSLVLGPRCRRSGRRPRTSPGAESAPVLAGPAHSAEDALGRRCRCRPRARRSTSRCRRASPPEALLGVLAGPDEKPDAVVVLRASHGDGQDELGLRAPVASIEVIPKTRMKKVGTGSRDVDVELLWVAAGGPVSCESWIGVTVTTAEPVRVAILRGFIRCAEVGVVGPGVHLARQESRAGERGGICSALHAQVIRPVPGHVDDRRRTDPRRRRRSARR